MNAEKIIAEIEWLEALFQLPDKRPLHIPATNLKEDEKIPYDLRFRLWNPYDV